MQTPPEINKPKPETQTKAPTFEEHVREFNEVVERRKKHDGIVKDLKARAQELEAVILEHFLQTGMSSVKIDGRTVFMATKIRSSFKAGFREQGLELLRTTGHEWLIKPTVNAKTLSAFVKECLADDSTTPLPEGFEEFFHIIKDTRINSRKA